MTHLQPPHALAASLFAAAFACASLAACQGGAQPPPPDARGGFEQRMASQQRDLPGPAPQDSADQEPNDTRADATPLPWPAAEPLLIAQGALASAHDTDIFSLGARAEGAVRVTLTPLTPHHDLKLTLLPVSDHGGASRATIDLGGAGAPESIPAVDARGGLLIQVNAGGASSQREESMGYRLQAQALPNPPPSATPSAAQGAGWPTEREPNDAVASASALGVGVDLQAWVNHSADTDAFTLSGPGPLDLSVWPTVGAPCPLRVQVLEPPFAERSLVWQGVAADGQPARYLSLRDDAFAVVVRPADGGKPCALSGQPLPYKLTLSPSASSPNPSANDTPEREPNDEADTPQALTLPASGLPSGPVTLRVRAALLSGDDVDRFRVVLPPPAPADAAKPHALRLVRAVATPADPSLDLALQAHLVEEVLDQSFDAARAGQPEALCDTVAHGPITLDLRVQPSAQSAPFTAARAYTLDLTLHTPDAAEREPNDLPAIASTLPASTPTSGHLYPEGDADTFAFHLSQPDHITLSLTSPPTLDLALALRDDTGANIARADKARAGQPERLSADLPAGQYYATISAQHGASCAAPYTLTLSTSQPPTAPSPPDPSPPTDAPQDPTPPNPAPRDLPPPPGLDLEF